MSKKHIYAVLRVLFALAGVTYIALTLTWRDQVVLPAGGGAGEQIAGLAAGKAYPVVEGQVDRTGARGDLKVAVAQADGSLSLVTVRAEQIGQGPGQAHLKLGVVTTFRTAAWGLAGLGLLLVAPVYGLQALRWWLLMRARGLQVAVRRAFGLYMVGAFFNYCMPGMTGGDVVKAYYAAKGSQRRADAVVSVVMDRVVGMVGMLVLACVAGLFMLAHPLARQVTMYLWLAAAGLIVGTLLYFSRSLRRILGLPSPEAEGGETTGERSSNARIFAGLKRLMGAVDRAVLGYRQAKGAVALGVVISAGVHLLLISAAALAGYALGLGTPLGVLLTVVPVIFMAGAVPLTYQGLGVMEGLGMALLLSPPLSSANQIVGMLLFVRLYQMAYAMLGSLWLLRGDIHLQEAEQEAGVGS
ncbi:MAG: flippase-like domain-containing protein [Phycisphaeraceae bacterium]|nr:flippase-like domain-containing protein [Phycisphaeraceae bacterium]